MFDQEVSHYKRCGSYVYYCDWNDRWQITGKNIQKKIYGDKTLNAIQRTTAQVCVWLYKPTEGKLEGSGFRNRKKYLLKYLQAINLGNYMNRNDYDSIIEKAITIQKEWRTVPHQKR